MQAQTEPVTLVIPYGSKRSMRVVLPPEVAAWLHAELGRAVGVPNRTPRRPVRLHRGKWLPQPRVV